MTTDKTSTTDAGGSQLERPVVPLVPKRVQISRAKGWRMPPNTVKVTRPGPWGNPFAAVKGRVCGGPPPDGPGWREAWFVIRYEHMQFKSKEEASSLAVRLFNAWIESPNPEQRKLLTAAQFALRGKNLACWCKPGAPCHADALLRLANHERHNSL